MLIRCDGKRSRSFPGEDQEIVLQGQEVRPRNFEIARPVFRLISDETQPHLDVGQGCGLAAEEGVGPIVHHKRLSIASRIPGSVRIVGVRSCPLPKSVTHHYLTH